MSFVVSLCLLSGAFLAVATLERLPRLRFAPSRFLRPHLATDAGWYVLATGSAAVTAVVLRPQLARLHVVSVGRLPLGVQLLLAVAVYDAVAFQVHRMIHRSHTLWEVHKVHHSSRRLDWLATTRTHLFEHLVRNVPAQLAVVAIGVPVTRLAAASAIYAVFALVGHSNLRVDLRAIEPVFITPRLHRIHHVPRTTERNFATVFSVWDRLAGTLVLADTAADEPLGVPGELDTYPQRLLDAFAEPGRRVRQRRRTFATTRD
jgi:lathosterol oxidase